MARLPKPKAGNFQHFRSLGLVGPPRRAKRRYERISQRSALPGSVLLEYECARVIANRARS